MDFENGIKIMDGNFITTLLQPLHKDIKLVNGLYWDS